jgi:hypothetical protein
MPCCGSRDEKLAGMSVYPLISVAEVGYVEWYKKRVQNFCGETSSTNQKTKTRLLTLSSFWSTCTANRNV